MSKMKTRCKHILDVTDRYCVLTEVNTGQARHMFLRFLKERIFFMKFSLLFFQQDTGGSQIVPFLRTQGTIL